MKKYQLLWKVKVSEPAPCPDFVPDPYTGDYPQTHCLVAHFTTKVREMDKTFDTLEEIEAFKKTVPTTCFDWQTLETKRIAPPTDI